MKLKEHEKECIKCIGKPYTEVHVWLDRFANHTNRFDTEHRRFTHHTQGIKEVETLFGPEAACAALLHIISDLKQYGWHVKRKLPEDTTDFIKMFGYFSII